MLTIYRRHSRSCPNAVNGRKNPEGCLCAIRIEGRTDDGRKVRESLKTRSWKQAQLMLAQFEYERPFDRLEKILDERENQAYSKLTDALNDAGILAGIIAAVPGRSGEQTGEIAIPTAIERFLNDAKARHLAKTTIDKLRNVTSQLKTYSEGKRFTSIGELADPDALAAFRETWTDSPVSALKKFERLRSFFKFCQDRDWIKKNPALALKPPRVKIKPTLPYTPEEMEKILWACDLLSTKGRYRSANRTRIKAMVLLMRYSGLRIQDAVTLKRDRIRDGKLFLYTQKTGTAVWLPLPPVVLSALAKLNEFQDRFFWAGNGKPETTVKVWEDSFRRLFAIAGLEGAHSHRFRDTFAVELLLASASLEHVSVLLGHSSIKTTERHYAPWVKARQQQLEAMVRASW